MAIGSSLGGPSTGRDGVAAASPRLGSTLGRQLRQALVEGDSVIALGLIGFILLLVQQATPSIIGIDGYFHIKFAWLMHQNGLQLRLDFPWLPLTILNPADFTDHHLLFHIFLIPFSFGDLRVGAKAATLLFATLAVQSTYELMSRLRVRYPLFWLVVLLASAEWFLTRMNMTRRQSLSLLLLMSATFLLIQGRYRWMLVAAFLYAWLFDGFVLLVAVVGIAFVARLVADRSWHWPMLGWTMAGLGLALLLNPYYPNNVTFTVLHVLPKLAPIESIRVGNEWYPFSPETLIRTSWLALAVPFAGLAPLLTQPRRALRDRTALLLLGLALCFLLLYLRSRRFIEVQPAFGALFCAYTWSHYGLNLRPPPRFETLASMGRPARIVGWLAIIVLLAVQLQQTVVRAQSDADDSQPFARFREPLQLVAENSAPGDRVFQTDWDDFPEMFFYNTYNTYIVGLDTTYMYFQNPELYLLWRSIGRGEVASPSWAIRELFKSRWVLSDRGHTGFIRNAEKDPGLEAVFQSGEAILYRVKEP